jgi:folate-dependent tRNA-U54 methylase TrmFO/GidA
MNANFGLFPPLAVPVKDKERKRRLIAQRALADHAAWMTQSGIS